MHVGALTLELRLPQSHSLKQKRSLLKPLIAAMHKQFNISVSEIEQNDHHQFAMLACAIVSNDAAHVQQVLGKIPNWIESRFPDIQLLDEQLIMF